MAQPLKFSAFSERRRLARLAKWAKSFRPLHRSGSLDSMAEKQKIMDRGESWVTLLLSDDQAWRSLRLLRSLRNNWTTRNVTLLITENVTKETEAMLEQEFDHVVLIHSKPYANQIDSPDFLKCHCWNLTEWDKCVFLDSGIVVNEYCDELFSCEEFSVLGPNSANEEFDTSIFVCSPSTVTYNRLLHEATWKIRYNEEESVLWSYFGEEHQYHELELDPRLYSVFKENDVNETTQENTELDSDFTIGKDKNITDLMEDLHLSLTKIKKTKDIKLKS